MKKRLLRWSIRLGILLAALLVLFLLRQPILRGIGGFLVNTDVPEQVDAAFVLSGAAKERTDKALGLYPVFVEQLITTGGMVSQSLQALGYAYTDSEVMREALLAAGVDTMAVAVISRGTSTYEESEEILGYALSKGYRRIMIVSSLHHTRRISLVFREKFRKSGIEVNLQGAEPAEYNADVWWQDEDGMIFVFNEYAKLVYYLWKY